MYKYNCLVGELHWCYFLLYSAPFLLYFLRLFNSKIYLVLGAFNRIFVHAKVGVGLWKNSISQSHWNKVICTWSKYFTDKTVSWILCKRVDLMHLFICYSPSSQLQRDLRGEYKEWVWNGNMHAKMVQNYPRCTIEKITLRYDHSYSCFMSFILICGYVLCLIVLIVTVVFDLF